MQIDLIHEECKFSFKGLSCKVCPLDCVYKNKSKVILSQRKVIEKLLLLNEKLRDENQELKRQLQISIIK